MNGQGRNAQFYTISAEKVSKSFKNIFKHSLQWKKQNTEKQEDNYMKNMKASVVVKEINYLQIMKQSVRQVLADDRLAYQVPRAQLLMVQVLWNITLGLLINCN